MADQTFPVSVEGVGDFEFRRRTYRLGVSAEAETARILGGDGVTENKGLEMIARALADLTVLTVAAPKAWVLEDLDPLDDADTERLLTVWRAYRAADRMFRDQLKSGRP